MVPYWISGLQNFIQQVGASEEGGQTLVEYALIIAFVAIVLIGALVFFGVSLSDIYESFANAFPNSGSGAYP